MRTTMNVAPSVLTLRSKGEILPGDSESIGVSLMEIIRIDKVEVASPESFSISIDFRRHELDRSKMPLPEGVREMSAIRCPELSGFKTANVGNIVVIVAKNTGATPLRFEATLTGRTVR